MPEAIPPVFPAVWKSGLNTLRELPSGGVALLIGGVDTGKTTFAALAAHHLAREGRSVLLLDADVGQGEIGPPGVVGTAQASKETARIGNWQVLSRHFVGVVTPLDLLGEHFIAVAHAIRFARQQSPDLVLADTTGLFLRGAGVRLKTMEVRLILPDLIIALGTDDRHAAFLRDMAHLSGAAICKLDTPSAVHKKTPAFRAARRLTRFAAALKDSYTLKLPLEQVTILHAPIGKGISLTVPQIEWAAKATNLPIVYGELGNEDDTVRLFTELPTSIKALPNRAQVAKDLGGQSLSLPSLHSLINAYIGLYDASGNYLSVGRCTGFDVPRKELTIEAPLPATDARIRSIRFGRLRIAADGRPIDKILPSELA